MSRCRQAWHNAWAPESRHASGCLVARAATHEHPDACVRRSSRREHPCGLSPGGCAVLDVEQDEKASDDTDTQEQSDNGDGVIGIALVRLCVPHPRWKDSRQDRG
jgi:hypothetical protein